MIGRGIMIYFDVIFVEMVESAKKVAKLDIKLTVEERNLLFVGYLAHRSIAFPLLCAGNIRGLALNVCMQEERDRTSLPLDLVLGLPPRASLVSLVSDLI